MTKKKVVVTDFETGMHLFRATMVVGAGAGIVLEDQQFYPSTAIEQLVLFGDTFFKEAKGLWEFSRKYGENLSLDSPNFAWNAHRVVGYMMSMYQCATRMVLVGGELVGVEALVQFFLSKGTREKFSGCDALIQLVEKAFRDERNGGEGLTKQKLFSVVLSEVVKLKGV